MWLFQFFSFSLCLFITSPTLSNLNRRLSHACIIKLYNCANPLMWTCGVWDSYSREYFRMPTRLFCEVRACCCSFGNSKGLYYYCWGKKYSDIEMNLGVFSICFYVSLLGSIFDMVLYSIFWFFSGVYAIHPFPRMYVILRRILEFLLWALFCWKDTK